MIDNWINPGWMDEKYIHIPHINGGHIAFEWYEEENTYDFFKRHEIILYSKAFLKQKLRNAMGYEEEEDNFYIYLIKDNENSIAYFMFSNFDLEYADSDDFMENVCLIPKTRVSLMKFIKEYI